jgi:hypothetical protein
LGCTCCPHQAYDAPPICSLATSTPSAGGGAALPNGRPKCAGSTVMLTAEMDAPVAANGHAVEIDILLDFNYRLATEPDGLPARLRLTRLAQRVCPSLFWVEVCFWAG